MLDDDTAFRPLDDEDKVQIAVADLAHSPLRRIATQKRANLRKRRKECPHRLFGQGHIVRPTDKPGSAQSISHNLNPLEGLLARFGTDASTALHAENRL